MAALPQILVPAIKLLRTSAIVQCQIKIPISNCSSAGQHAQPTVQWQPATNISMQFGEQVKQSHSLFVVAHVQERIFNPKGAHPKLPISRSIASGQEQQPPEEEET